MVDERRLAGNMVFEPSGFIKKFGLGVSTVCCLEKGSVSSGVNLRWPSQSEPNM